MISKEILKNIRRIEITTNRLVTDVFAGQYHSVFKGQGMEFDEVREYQIGDDTRAIDWNVTARTGKPHIKKFVEERELTVMILVDASRSCHFATVKQLKSKLAAEIAATLAFSAIRNNDKVGLIVFTDRIEKFIPPRKGPKHVLRVVREVLYHESQGRLTDIRQALDYLNRVTTRKAVGFILSDFFESTLPSSPLPLGEGKGEGSFKKALRMANRRHDMIAIALNDPAENELPDCGVIELEDAETGEKIVIDSSDEGLRRRYREQSAQRLEERNGLFNSVGMDHIDLSTNIPFAQELVKFFLKRRRKLR